MIDSHDFHLFSSSSVLSYLALFNHRNFFCWEGGMVNGWGDYKNVFIDLLFGLLLHFIMHICWLIDWVNHELTVQVSSPLQRAQIVPLCHVPLATDDTTALCVTRNSSTACNNLPISNFVCRRSCISSLKRRICDFWRKEMMRFREREMA